MSAPPTRRTAVATATGPMPRFRLYTSAAGYAGLLTDGLLGRAQGRAVDELERAVCAYTGAARAHAMPMARVAIYMAVRALIRPGQKVILSPYTISDVVNMVVCAGGVPVFADLEADTCNIAAAEVERLLDDDTGAVLVTHLYGLACDIERIAAACRARNVPLIEDAAQAFGTRVAGRHVGTFGDAGIFSFGLFKNVNAFLGGLLVTNRADLHERVARAMADLPRQPFGPVLHKALAGAAADTATWPPLFRLLTFPVFRYAYLHDLGILNRRVSVDTDPEMLTTIPPSYLARLSPMQARLALRQLARVDADAERRVAAARIYHAGLRDLPDLVLPPLRTDGSHTYSYFPIQYADREALVRHVLREGRDIAVSHHKNCADLPCFAAFRHDCPNAARTANGLIYLPTYPGYAAEEVERTVAAIRSFFASRRA